MSINKMNIRAGLVLADVEEIINSRTAKYEDVRNIGPRLRFLLADVIIMEREMRPKDMERKMILEQMMNKLARYLVNWPKGDKDSLNDLIGYAAMLQAHDEHIRDKGDGSHEQNPNF